VTKVRNRFPCQPCEYLFSNLAVSCWVFAVTSHWRFLSALRPSLQRMGGALKLGKNFEQVYPTTI